jgi:hypothetical protein
MLSPAPANISFLVVLEALLFLNYPVWDRVTAYGAPQDFALQLGLAAAAATLVCHVGPATLAAHWRPPRWLATGLGLWIILGNLLVIGLLAFRFWNYTPYLVILGSLTAAAIAPLRRILALLLLALEFLVLLWALYDKREGLVEAAYRLRMPFPPWNEFFIVEPLVAAAPAVAIAWLIGQNKPGAKTIWVTGLLGLTLPMVASFAAATAARAAGWNLLGVSKLFLGFGWAILPPAGFEDWTQGAYYLSHLAPVLVGAVVIQELLPPGRRLLHTVWPAALATLLGYIGSHSRWEGNADRAWALSLLLLGLASPIVYFAWRRKYRT